MASRFQGVNLGFWVPCYCTIAVIFITTKWDFDIVTRLLYKKLVSDEDSENIEGTYWFHARWKKIYFLKQK